MEIFMMEHIPTRSFIQQCKRITLFNIGNFRISYRNPVHIQIVDGNLYCGKADILKGNNIIFQYKLLLDHGFSRLIVMVDNILICCLCSKVRLININCHFRHSCCRAGDRNRFLCCNFYFWIILQHILYCVGKCIRDGVIIEGDYILRVNKGEC